MRLIDCDRPECGQTTYLIDEEVTLDKGWATGTDGSQAPFYVCPHHIARYTLMSMSSAVITKPQREPEPEQTGDTNV